MRNVRAHCKKSKLTPISFINMDFGSLFKKMILLLVFLQFILTQGQSQFYSKESNDKIIDSYFNLNINCILEILETPIEENSN